MMTATSNAMNFPILTATLALPAIGAFLCWVLSDRRIIRWVAAATAVVTFLLSAFILIRYQSTGRSASQWLFQFSDRHSWISSLPGIAHLGITYWIGVDGVSVFLVALTGLIMAIAIVAATFMIDEQLKVFLVLMLFLETAVLGVFVSVNLFLFFVFWEAMLIPSYFLLGIWGEERRVYATMKFVVYTIFGSFLMLVAIFYLWTQVGTLDMVGPHGLLSHPVSGPAQNWLFLAFALAFAIKLGMFPFHTWAPTAYAESPTPFLIALAGILSKAGAFGFIRYCLPLFPSASHEFQGLISVLAIIGMLYAAGLALVQTDIKRVVAYSSVSHMNLILLGIFALNSTGVDGSVLQMINHSVIITGLFLAVAYIAARTGTRSINALGGLGRGWPVLMWLFFVFVLGGLDLPGLGSFAGEFLILAGVFRENAWFSAIGALTTIMAAWYMIRLFQNTMNAPVLQTATPAYMPPIATPAIDSGREADSERTERVVEPEEASPSPYRLPVVGRLIPGDLLPGEVLLLVPLLLLVVYIGIKPGTLTQRMDPTVSHVTSLVRQAQFSAGGGQ